MNYQYKNSIIKFIIYILLIFLIFWCIVQLFYKENEVIDNTVTTSTIDYNDENTSIHVEYPRYKNDELNKSITNVIYSYIRDFKLNSDKKVLDVTYELYNFKDYANITFHIENNLSNIKNRNILLNIKENRLESITSVYDEDYLKDEINYLVFYKYSSEIYNKIKDEDINEFTYIIDDNKMVVYFNNIIFDNIDYIPFVTIYYESEVSYQEDELIGDKYIAFTYDDGPSIYTEDLLKILEASHSSATFFMLGNRMKLNKDIVSKIYSSNSEIGSHSYAHKDLTNLSNKELIEDLNSTQIIYNEITHDNITLLRPPYGRYNNMLLNEDYKIILWSIDPKDWLVKNDKTIYNNVVKNACDGCIVLLHDIYPETLEATKRLIPALNEKGYNIVSVSKLMEIKEYTYNNKPIDKIK